MSGTYTYSYIPIYIFVYLVLVLVLLGTYIPLLPLLATYGTRKSLFQVFPKPYYIGIYLYFLTAVKQLGSICRLICNSKRRKEKRRKEEKKKNKNK